MDSKERLLDLIKCLWQYRLMKTKKAIKLAGSAVELAHILGVTRQAVTNWVDVLPGLRVYQLKEKKPQWFEVKK